VEYWKIFLEEIANYESYIAGYEGETMDKVLLNLFKIVKKNIFW